LKKNKEKNAADNATTESVSGDGNVAVDEAGAAETPAGDESGVVIDAEPKKLSVKQRRKKDQLTFGSPPMA